MNLWSRPNRLLRLFFFLAVACPTQAALQPAPRVSKEMQDETQS